MNDVLGRISRIHPSARMQPGLWVVVKEWVLVVQRAVVR